MELMMVLGVTAIILAFAAPSFREFRMNGRMTSAANDILSALQQARSESVKRQRIVSLCASDNPGAAAPSCTANFGGWVMWEDVDGDAAIDAGEQVINRHDALDGAITLNADGNFVSYAPNGFTRDTVGGTRAVRVVKLCDQRGDDVAGAEYRKRVVSVSRTGRPSIVKSLTAVASLDEAMRQEELTFDFSCPQGS